MVPAAPDEPTLPADTMPDGRSSRESRPGPVLAGYSLGDVIGRGGMGDVIAAQDQRIGRDVAIKRMRSSITDQDLIARFLREAKIQARLDHPAIVPVYELGNDDAGRPYFVMKRLRGRTLQDHLSEHAPLHATLRAFVDVCRAIELAHLRGVVHRDLKPSNVMLGSFGEVYVLDWGIARLLDDGETSAMKADVLSEDGTTVAGSLLGTPGYMSPEQIHDAATVARPGDVYSLGAILFEILAGRPLHPPGAAAIESTLGTSGGSPARRAPEREIAPELDSLCARALALEPSQRPVVGELAREVQRYLDGDRDLERRRAMAAEQLANARAARAAGARGDAMRAAGRAVALDPAATDAAELVTALMLEPSSEPSPELHAELVSRENADVSRHGRIAAAGYLAVVAIFPIALWNGVEDWRLLGTAVAMSLVQSLLAWSIARAPSGGPYVIYAFGNAAMISVFDRMFGPFVFAPLFACLLMMSLLLYPTFARGARMLIPLLLLGWCVPICLERLGVLAPTWDIAGGSLRSMSQALRIGGTSTAVLLLCATFAPLAIAGVLAASAARVKLAAQRQLVTQAWHLRQLLPEHRRPA